MDSYRGVMFPAGYDRWPNRDQQAWMDGVDRRLARKARAVRRG